VEGECHETPPSVCIFYYLQPVKKKMKEEKKQIKELSVGDGGGIDFFLQRL
jgi:hypothetical protein